MKEKRNFLTTGCRRMNAWLHSRCDRLTTVQRKVIVYGLSTVYLICSLVMTARLFRREKRSTAVRVETTVRKDSIRYINNPIIINPNKN